MKPVLSSSTLPYLPNQPMSEVIEQYRADVGNARLIISTLNGRVQHLEGRLAKEKVEKHTSAQAIEDKLYDETVRREDVEKELKAAKDQLADLTRQNEERLRQIGLLQVQAQENAQHRGLLEVQIAALRQQTEAQGRELQERQRQIDNLSVQLEAQRIQVAQLTNQVAQLVRTIQEQNRMTNQREITPIDQNSIGGWMEWAVRDLFDHTIGGVFNLPRLNKPN